MYRLNSTVYSSYTLVREDKAIRGDGYLLYDLELCFSDGMSVLFCSVYKTRFSNVLFILVHLIILFQK